MTRCALVLVTRGDLVLGLTRGSGRPTDALTWLADLHLPGGKEEPEDGSDPRVTAARELREETGLRVRAGDLRHVIDVVSPTGFPVSAFATPAPSDAPDHFEPRPSIGQPGWVPPGALVQPWCSLRQVAAAVLHAAGIDLPPGAAHAECPDCETWHACAEERGGLRLPVHRSHPEDPRSLLLCSGSLALLDRGTLRIDAATTAGLAELVVEARAAASLAGALRDLGSRGRA